MVLSCLTLWIDREYSVIQAWHWPCCNMHCVKKDHYKKERELSCTYPFPCQLGLYQGLYIFKLLMNKAFFQVPSPTCLI